MSTDNERSQTTGGQQSPHATQRTAVAKQPPQKRQRAQAHEDHGMYLIDRLCDILDSEVRTRRFTSVLRLVLTFALALVLVTVAGICVVALFAAHAGAVQTLAGLGAAATAGPVALSSSRAARRAIRRRRAHRRRSTDRGPTPDDDR